MLVLALPRHVVEAALPAVEQRLARRPDAWSSLAARGKLRRLLGDRGGFDDLRTAAETYLRVHAAAPSLLTPAHLHLLAGDDRARPLLERLRAEGDGPLAEACFLLGDSAAAQAAAVAPRQRALAQLAAGRAARDVALVDEALRAFDRLAAADRAIATGGMGGHDWLEVALVTRVEVSGEPSDRLRAL